MRGISTPWASFMGQADMFSETRVSNTKGCFKMELRMGEDSYSASNPPATATMTQTTVESSKESCYTRGIGKMGRSMAKASTSMTVPRNITTKARGKTMKDMATSAPMSAPLEPTLGVGSTDE